MSDFYLSNIHQTLNSSSICASPPSSTCNDPYSVATPVPHAGHWSRTTGNEPMEEPKPAPRRRRPSGNDHVKHRRTRNGCYTCRGRRVKCDEIRPVCERCKKGNRDCTYPEPRATPKPAGSLKRDQSRTAADDSQSSSDETDTETQVLIPGQRKEKTKTNQIGLGTTDDQSQPSPSSHDALDPIGPPQGSVEHVGLESSLSPSTDSSGAHASTGWEKSEKLSSVSTEASQEANPWSYLPADLQYFLNYHQSQLTYHHYFFKHDANYFLHHILVEQALHYEPLLYAVVGFSAYQSTVQRPNGKIQHFLGYYNQSVSLLRKSLQSNQKHTDATMLTMLQLAHFEDYLGDLVSLLEHQKAAYGMLLELYTPNSIMETEVRRKILAWYLRFDVMGGMMAGHSGFLGREWLLANEAYYREQSLSYPSSIDYKIEAMIASHRLLGSDLALLHARKDITSEEFARESERYSQYLDTWKERLDPIFLDEQHIVKSFGSKRPDPDDIVDPYRAGGLYHGALFPLNIVVVDWTSLNLVHKLKTAKLLNRAIPPDVEALALEICRMFETIELWPESPPGAIVKSQGSLGLAIVFLPYDKKHITWCRQKLAKVESLGHIYPAALRHQMANKWGLPEVNEWWLPDESARPPVVRSVQAFMEDRLSQTNNTSRSEDQRGIKGIFSRLSLDEDATTRT